MANAARVLAGLLAVLVLGGCGGHAVDGQSTAESSGSSSAAAEPDTGAERQEFDPPTEFAQDGPQLQWPDAGPTAESYWPHLDTLTMHGDLAITYGQNEPGVVAIDMASGDFRWRFPVEHVADDANPRGSAIADIDGEPTLFVAFQIETEARGTRPSGESLRLYALTTHGEQLWQSEVPASGGPELWLYSEVVAADDEYVVVNSRNDDGHVGSTTVFSVRDREPVWHREHVAAVALRDGVVVAREYDGAGAQGVDAARTIGLHAADGSSAWESTEGYGVLDGGGNAAWLPAIRGESWQDDFGLLEATTGKVTRVPVTADPADCRRAPAACFSAEWDCHNDRQAVTACSSVTSSARVLVAFDHTTGEPLWQLPDPSAGRVAPESVTTAWHGALYATLEEQGLILDLRSGRDQVTGLPKDLPIRVNERFGAFHVTDDQPGLVAEFRRAVG